MTDVKELQETCLGLLITHPDATVDLAARILAPGMFTTPKHQKIFGTILAMADAGTRIDLVALAAELRSEVTAGDLADLTTRGGVGSASNFEYYARQVAAADQATEGRRIALQLGEQLKGANGNTTDVLNTGLRDLHAVADRQVMKADRSLSEIAEDLSLDIQWAADHPGELPGITTTFQHLDRLTHGFQPATSILVGAYTSVGKSALSQQMAVRQAKAGIPVAFVTIEMTAKEVLLRMAAQVHRINAQQIRYPTSPGQSAESQQIIKKMTEIRDLHIIETPGIRLQELTAMIRSMVRRHGVRIIYIDYLNLVSGDLRRDGSRYLELAEISRALKQLSIALNICVVSMAQLGRDAGDHSPRLKDVRESMDLAFDADIVLFLHRERFKEGDVEMMSEDASLSIAKHRNGPLGTVRLRFHSGYLTFEEA